MYQIAREDIAMLFKRRPPNRLFYGAQRYYIQPYRQPPPMISSPSAAQTAVPTRPPYDPETFYECDGGMIPFGQSAEKQAPEETPTPVTQMSTTYTTPQRFPQDEALVHGTLFPELFTPMRRGRR